MLQFEELPGFKWYIDEVHRQNGYILKLDIATPRYVSPEMYYPNLLGLTEEDLHKQHGKLIAEN